MSIFCVKIARFGLETNKNVRKINALLKYLI